MASFATDGKVCIEREIEVLPLEVDDLLTRFDVVETSKWISRNNFLKVCVCYQIERFQSLTDAVINKAQFKTNSSCVWWRISTNLYSLFYQVCLQFPDELLSVSAQVYEEIKKRVDVDLYILGDTSYAR